MKCRKVDSIISSQVLPAIHLEDPAVVVIDVVVVVVDDDDAVQGGIKCGNRGTGFLDSE